MFANAVYEPALTLAQTLLQQIGNPRLSKVFYTDNGSTGMEVAVKMALRAASKRHNWDPEDDVEILGLICARTLSLRPCQSPIEELCLRTGKPKSHIASHSLKKLALSALISAISRTAPIPEFRLELEATSQTFASSALGMRFDLPISVLIALPIESM
jgi:hypothetical protein